MDETQDSIKQNAREAREWADAADDEATKVSSAPSHPRKRAGMFAAVSQAHSLAAIATALGEGYLSAEVELVKFAGAAETSPTQPAVPVVPAPATPARGVLVPNQRVIVTHTEGHVWPDVLKTVGGEPYQGIMGAVVEADRETDLVKVICDAPGTGVGRAGPTIQVHREQLRIPAPDAQGESLGEFVEPEPVDIEIDGNGYQAYSGPTKGRILRGLRHPPVPDDFEMWMSEPESRMIDPEGTYIVSEGDVFSTQPKPGVGG